MIVVGSSPNALVAALLLARQGNKVLVLEPGEVGGPIGVIPSSRIDDAVADAVGLPRAATPRASENTLLDQAAALLLQQYRSGRSVMEDWRALGRRQSMEVLRLPWMSARDLLQEWFPGDDAMQGKLAALAVRGVRGGPFGAGTAFQLIHQWAMGEGSFPLKELLGLCESAGVEIRSGVPISRFVLEEGRIAGVQVGDEVLPATRVYCDDDARYTFTHWISPRELETNFNRSVARQRYRGCVSFFRFAGDATWSAPSVAYVEQAYDGTKPGRTSFGPVLEVHADGRGWCQFGDRAAAEAALGLPITEWLGPDELAARYRLTQGHLFGGDATLDQMFFLRSASRTPVEGLFLCGATTHPGGYSGLSGMLAVR